MLDYLPVGVLITSESDKVKIYNKEFVDNLPKRSQAAKMCKAVAQATDQKGRKSARAQLLDSLTCIVDEAVSGRNLKTAIERKDDHNGQDQRYLMTCAQSRKVFEVKTKYIPFVVGRGYKIAIVKDQTVYQQLIKEKMVEKSQRMLLASITHEIRNPLNAIEGFRGLVLESTDIAQVKPVSDRLASAVQHIDLVVSGACDLMLSETKSARTQVESFDVQKAILDILQIIRPTTDAKHVRTRVTVKGLHEGTFWSDVKMYQQVLFQLMTNAAKYTAEGEIAIEARYDPLANCLTTSVSDTGPGISPDKRDRLFELYANMDNANEFNPQGMGLGLALCKRLCKRLGGDIHLRSLSDRGTTFIFTVRNATRTQNPSEADLPEEAILESFAQDLKLFQSHPPPQAPSEEKKAERPKESKEPGSDVLIVDDDPTNRLVLKAYINSVQLTVDEAENGQEAIEKVQCKLHHPHCCRYKLILMDINMPVMDGTTATRQLEGLFSEHAEARAPIVAITAANLQSQDDFSSLRDLGFQDICI